MVKLKRIDTLRLNRPALPSAFLLTTALLLAVPSARAQFRSSQDRPDVPGTPSAQPIPFFVDPAKFSIQNSVAFGMASSGRASFGYGLLSSNLRYLLTDKIAVTGNVHLLQPTFQGFQASGPNGQVLYDLNLHYRWSDNFRMSFSLGNGPSLPHRGSWTSPVVPSND